MDDMRLSEKELLQTITDLVNHAATLKIFRDEILTFHPYDLAEAFLTFDEIQRRRFYESLDASEMADIFEHFDEEDAVFFMAEMDQAYTASVLQEMDRDDAADILHEFDDEDVVESYLSLMDDESRTELSALRTYEEETAGAIMTTNLIAIPSGLDVKEAMKTIVAEADDTESVSRIFIVDEAQRLLGILNLKELIKARSPKTVDMIMEKNFQFVLVTENQEDVANKIRNYSIYVMPVLDENHTLLGVITMDDAADILEEEADEDYSKFAAMPSALSMDETLIKTAWHRLPWLVLLLFLGLIVSSIISRFEDTIAQVTVLVLFQPLILGMAGNTGTQSLAVTVRGLSRDNFTERKTVYRHLFKEFRVGLLNGAGIAILAFMTTSLFLLFTGSDTNNILLVALVVAFSAFVALAVASLCGAFFPLLLNKMKIDPAAASGPFITTVNDILALSIYFTLATILILPRL